VPGAKNRRKVPLQLEIHHLCNREFAFRYQGLRSFEQRMMDFIAAGDLAGQGEQIPERRETKKAGIEPNMDGNPIKSNKGSVPFAEIMICD
jgi:hypothetical protein